MSIEQAYQRKKNIIEELKDDMEKCFGQACQYRGIKLWDKEKGVPATYFLTAMEEVDCMSEETTYNWIGNRIEQLVLDKEKIGKRVAFWVKGYKRNGFIARLDYVESILRRKARGIRFEEICVS